MKILGISGSLQQKSGNRELLEVAARRAPAGVVVTTFDGLRDLPHFDPDLERSGPLPVVERLRAAIRDADALLIASPEYGHSLPGSLKNAIDWLIGSGELERKVVAITAAVPHPDRGRLGLRALAGTLAAVSAVIVGGESIARGAEFEDGVERLLCALVAEAERQRE